MLEHEKLRGRGDGPSLSDGSSRRNGPAPDDHVVLSWAPECGTCAYCLKGRPYLCTSSYMGWMEGLERTFRKGSAEIFRMTGVGTFSERSVVVAAACIKIPEEIPLDRACLIGCGVMTGVGAAMNTARIRPGDNDAFTAMEKGEVARSVVVYD